MGKNYYSKGDLPSYKERMSKWSDSDRPELYYLYLVKGKSYLRVCNAQLALAEAEKNQVKDGVVDLVAPMIIRRPYVWDGYYWVPLHKPEAHGFNIKHSFWNNEIEDFKDWEHERIWSDES